MDNLSDSGPTGIKKVSLRRLMSGVWTGNSSRFTFPYSISTNRESIYNIPINSFLHLTFTTNLKMIRVIRISELGTNLWSVLRPETISSLNQCSILLPPPLTFCLASDSMQTQVSKFVEKLKRIHLSRLFVLLIFGLINVTPRFRHISRKPCCTKNEHRNLICFLEYNDMHLLYWFKFCFRQRLFPKRTGKPHTQLPHFPII